MGKIDIKNAHRIIPIHPDDRYLLGMKWRDQYFVDLALPFGLRSAPGISDLLHYLDDCFTLGRAGSVTCSNRSPDRCNAPFSIPASPLFLKGATALQPVFVFWGIELDSEHVTALA